MIEFNVDRIKKKVSLHKRTQSFKNILQKTDSEVNLEFVLIIFFDKNK